MIQTRDTQSRLVAFGIKVDQAELEMLDRVAKLRGTTRSALVRDIIRAYFLGTTTKTS